MTREERNKIKIDFDEVPIEPEEPMNIIGMQYYVKGLQDARMAMLDSVERSYRMMKTD